MRRLYQLVFVVIFGLSFGMPNLTHAENIWGIYGAAGKAAQHGNYREAIEAYQQVVQIFVQKKEYTNAALTYSKIGDAEVALSIYDKAVNSWYLEAKYWGLAGRDQEQIAAGRKADILRSRLQVFVKMNAQAVSDRFYHGAKFEPKLGAYLGAYAENDQKVHDTVQWSYFYTERFPSLTGKKHAAYLLYFTYEQPFTSLWSHIEHLKQSGAALQLAIEPLKGLDEVKDDEYLRNFAREAGKAGIPIFLRFANEMNGNWVPWYGDPKKYIEKFRLVSHVFKQEAPDNVAMVWAPNDFPPNTIQQYYPGDDVVDWVGVSMYSTYDGSLDPLHKGIDRRSHVEKFEQIYRLYAARKPVFISEGGISPIDPKTGANRTEWAEDQIQQFYASLPMLYPGVKAVFWFDWKDYMLSANKGILGQYKESVNNPFYLSEIGEEAPFAFLPVEESGIPPREVELDAYAKTVSPEISKVEYQLNGKTMGQAVKPPWTITYDFLPYKGKPIDLGIRVYNAQNKLTGEKKIQTYVGDDNVMVDGKRVDFDSQPKIVNNRTFVPLRQISEALNSKVNWNPTTQTVTLTNGENVVALTINKKTGHVNGKVVALEAAPFLYHSRTYVPIGFIAEQGFDLEKSWDSVTNTAEFQSKVVAVRKNDAGESVSDLISRAKEMKWGGLWSFLRGVIDWVLG